MDKPHLSVPDVDRSSDPVEVFINSWYVEIWADHGEAEIRTADARRLAQFILDNTEEE